MATARFLIIFVPTCGLAALGLWLIQSVTGFWSVVGWIVAIPFGLFALAQVLAFLNGLGGIAGAEARLRDLEERDAQMFQEGKAFDEVMSQYKRK